MNYVKRKFKFKFKSKVTGATKVVQLTRVMSLDEVLLLSGTSLMAMFWEHCESNNIDVRRYKLIGYEVILC